MIQPTNYPTRESKTVEVMEKSKIDFNLTLKNKNEIT